MKKSLFFFVLLLSFITFRLPALADDEVRKLVVDLKAKGFSQSEWQDNLSSSNIIFAPTDKFQLQLKISNQGNRNQTQIKVSEALPSNVTTDSAAEFIIPQIAAGQDYVQNITVTVKNKAHVYQALTDNSLRFTAKSEIGTEGSDTLSFATNNGTKSTSVSTSSATTKGSLPATGAASTILLGSVIASVLAFAGYKLRSFARGY